MYICLYRPHWRLVGSWSSGYCEDVFGIVYGKCIGTEACVRLCVSGANDRLVPIKKIWIFITFSTLCEYPKLVRHSLHSLKQGTNITGTYVITVGLSACFCSRKATEWLACQGRLWSLLAVTLRLNQLSGSSPSVGNMTSRRCCRGSDGRPPVYSLLEICRESSVCMCGGEEF
jgi:hypothetical protein